VKKLIRATLALAILFLASSAVATTQFDGPTDPPMCFPGQVCN